jgi:succinate dehydrogenase / fumarate reductase cytochrome b subunit
MSRYLGLSLTYRGGAGSWAYVLHRLSGIGVWLFIVLHVLDIWLVGNSPQLYDEVLAFYASPVGRLMETALGAALLYHALNGMRILLIDLWPSFTPHHRKLWIGCWVIFFGVGIPGALIILRPIWQDLIPAVAQIAGIGGLR